MKSAFIVARTKSGWKLHRASDDVAEVKTAFKSIMEQRSMVVGGEPASVVWYFDTGGNVRRKRLATPDEREAIDKLNGEAEAKREAAEQKEADAKAQADGSAKALDLAQRAVDVIVSGLQPKDAELGRTASGPASGSSDEEDDPRSRFGGKPKAKR